jgi:hypothetical protein
VLRPSTSSGSELKSRRGSRGPHQQVFRPTAVIERWRVAARTQLLLSAMAGGSSKGLFQLGLCQRSEAQRWQARRAVTVAQNTVKRRRYAWERQLGFSSDFARISHESLPIYRGFPPRSCVARIQPESISNQSLNRTLFRIRRIF